MTPTYHLTARQLGHRFGNQWLFRKVSFQIQQGQRLIVRGKNGSGKSTLLRLAGDLLLPAEGTIHLEPAERYIKLNRHFWMGYLAPSLGLYGELSGRENISLALEARGLKETETVKQWIDGAGLTLKDWNKPYKSYSSGMKQRTKFLVSCLHQPSLLLLDEPFSTLDRQGKNWIRSLLPVLSETCVMLIATNDEEDFDLSPDHINLDEFK